MDDHQKGSKIGLNFALDFFCTMRFPDEFFLELVHPRTPKGSTLLRLPARCKMYVDFSNDIVRGLYPSPKGMPKVALDRNLGFLYEFTDDPSCPQISPYGK